MQAPHRPRLRCKPLTSGSFLAPRGAVLRCGDPSSSQPSQTSALTEGTWEGCSVLCGDASRRPGARAGGLAASSGLWAVPGWTWGRGALSRRASSLPSRSRRRWASVLSAAAAGKTEAPYSSSDKSPRSWGFATPGNRHNAGVTYTKGHLHVCESKIAPAKGAKFSAGAPFHTRKRCHL